MVQMKKRTKRCARRGRSHLALKKVVLTKCPQCGKAVRPHMACSFCGTYKGRQVIKIKEKAKKEKK